MDVDALRGLLERAALTDDEIAFHLPVPPPGEPGWEAKRPIAQAQLQKAARVLLWGLADYLVWWADSIREDILVANPDDDWFKGYWRALGDLQYRIADIATTNDLRRPHVKP